MSKREKIYLRVAKGCLQPADDYAASRLRERGYKIGDVLAAEISKPRSLKFNRLVHQIGILVGQNIDSFAGLDAHRIIKRLQIEGKIACDEIGVMVPSYGMVIQFIPRSFSFDSMSEEEYYEAARGICRTISERYWKDCTPEEIEGMAQLMIGE